MLKATVYSNDPHNEDDLKESIQNIMFSISRGELHCVMKSALNVICAKETVSITFFKRSEYEME
jgi:hypothetical protein